METKDKTPQIVLDRVSLLTCSHCGCKIDVAGLEPFVKIECPDCGSEETVPGKLGHFIMLKLLGTGGMGGVYYAHDETLNRFVAIKVMLASLGENEQFVKIFKQEAQAAAQLNHPNIAQIYSFGQEKGLPYIVMEFVSGQHFDTMIETGMPLDQALVMHVGLDIAEGLQAADEIGLIHGDIKPENILLDEKMQAKLVDFGIATFANQVTDHGIWGTPYYIAPEKIKRKKSDARSDIYSLGATLYHALAGIPPFEGKTPIDVVKARLEHAPQELHLVRNDISEHIETIISRMLQVEPAMRYPNYASLISDLRKVIKKLGGLRKNRTDLIGKKRKKLVLTKKHLSTTAAAEKSSTGQQKDTGKLVVHKKNASEANSAIDEYKKRSAKSSESARKKRSKAWLWIMLIIFLLMASTGLGIYLKDRYDKKIAARKELFALKDQKENAERIFGDIQLSVTNILTISDIVPTYIAKATNAVFVVIGEPLDIQPPETNMSPAKIEKSVTVAAPVASVVHRTPATKPENNKGLPPGMPTREELDRLKGKTHTSAPDFPKKPVKPEKPKKIIKEPPKPVKDTTEPVKEQTAPEKEPEVKILARKVICDAREVSKNIEVAGNIASNSMEIKDQAINALNSITASNKIYELSKNLASVQQIEEDTKKTMQNIKESAEKADAIRIKVEKEREVVKRAKEEELRQKKEREEQIRREKAHKELMKRELALVKTAQKESLILIKHHKYKEATDNITAQLPKYQTDEGREAAKILIDLYSRLHGLKLFIIERLNADPFKWGWIRPRQDVLSADKFGVKLTKKSIPWEKVNIGQMLSFIEHYLSPPANFKVRQRVLGEQSLAAAIFCYENGGSKASARYAKKAVNLCSDLQKEVIRLIPQKN